MLRYVLVTDPRVQAPLRTSTRVSARRAPRDGRSDRNDLICTRTHSGVGTRRQETAGSRLSIGPPPARHIDRYSTDIVDEWG